MSIRALSLISTSRILLHRSISSSSNQKFINISLNNQNRLYSSSTSWSRRFSLGSNSTTNARTASFFLAATTTSAAAATYHTSSSKTTDPSLTPTMAPVINSTNGQSANGSAAPATNGFNGAPFEISEPAQGVQSKKMHSKVVIIGSGPAGHTAAIYLARAELKPVLFEGMLANGFAPGGQLTTTTEVDNFPGFPEGVRGPEMMDKFRAQSERFGTVIITETIAKVDLTVRPFKYWREGEEEDADFETADAIILATGASAKRLNLPGEEEYWQSGISACAVCDGAVPIFRNKPLAVIGGGDSAAEEATYLTKYASHVYVLVRRGELRASKIMQKRLTNHPKVTVMWHSVATACEGDGDLLQNLKVQNVQTNEITDLPVNGLFYAIGHEPATSLVRDQLFTDSDGYIVTIPGTTQTSIKGVFAAGDVQDKKYRQAITSAGSGCMAALEAERLISEEESDDSEIPEEQKHIPSDALTGYLGADKE